MLAKILKSTGNIIVSGMVLVMLVSIITTSTVASAQSATQFNLNAEASVSENNGAQIDFSWSDISENPYTGTGEVEYSLICYKQGNEIATKITTDKTSATFKEAEFNTTYGCVAKANLTFDGITSFAGNSNTVQVTTPGPLEFVTEGEATLSELGTPKVKIHWNDITKEPFTNGGEATYNLTCYDTKGNIAANITTKEISAELPKVSYDTTYGCIVQADILFEGIGNYVVNSESILVTTPKKPTQVTQLSELNIEIIHRGFGTTVNKISFIGVQLINAKVKYRVFRVSNNGIEEIYSGDKTQALDKNTKDKTIFGYYIVATVEGSPNLTIDAKYVAL